MYECAQTPVVTAVGVPLSLVAFEKPYETVPKVNDFLSIIHYLCSRRLVEPTAPAGQARKKGA